MNSDTCLNEAHHKSTPKQKSVRPHDKNDSTAAQEKDTNERQSSSSPLAVAIDSVAQLDENSIDKSLKDIHNAVQALACHSNVSSALSNESASSDMCMNAVKKLALTISMVNAFHMYRRIIDDVSGFPLCFPSTSFDSSKDNMKCVQRSGAHSSEDPMDIGRLSWFQDIMRNFFSNSICNDVYDGGRKCMLRSCANDLCPEVTSICSEQSKFASKNKVSLRAIDSACKNPTCKSVCSHHEDDRVFSEPNEMQKTNDSGFINECGSCSECTPVRSSCCENSRRVSMSDSNKVLYSPETTSKPSLSSQTRQCSHHSPLSDVQNSGSQLLLTTADANLQKSRKRVASNSSVGNLDESVQETFNESKHKRPVKPKKSPRSSFKSSKSINVSPKTVKNRAISRMASNVKIRAFRKSVVAVSKPQKVSLVAKKHGIRTSKKMKEQKRIQRHRLSVLKKVNFNVKSPEVGVEAPKQSLKSPRTVLKEKDKRNTLLSAKQIRESLKFVKQAKSRASTSSSASLSTKIALSPKLLRKRNEKRKSIAFKSLGLRSKNSDPPAKGKKRKSMVTITSPRKQLPKKARGRKGNNISENVKVDHAKDKETEPATRSRSTRKHPEVDTEMPNIRKQRGRKARTLAYNEDDVDSDIMIVDIDTDSPPVVKSRNTKRVQAKNAKSLNSKKQRSNKTHSLFNNESKIVDSLDIEIVDLPDGKDVAVGKSTERNAKLLKRVSLTPVKQTRNLRKRACKNLSQEQNTNESLDSQVSQNAVDFSQNLDKDLVMKGAKPTESIPKSGSSKMKTKRGRRKASSSGKHDNQDNQMPDEQSTSNKKFGNEKEQILSDKLATPKKITRGRPKKNTAIRSSEDETKKILEAEVEEISENTEGTVLKEITRNAATRALRSKRLRTDAISTESTIVEKAREMQNKSGRSRRKRKSLDADVIYIEESLLIDENDGNENQSKTKRGRRKKVNKTEDEIPPKKVGKNSKKSEKGKSDEDLPDAQIVTDDSNEVVLIKESTTVVDSQKKRRKVNAGDENVPRHTPKRGRNKKIPVENTKEKINQTEVTTRSLRSRK